MDIRHAMNRAFSLGQTYWQQADSESYSQNRKADETLMKFRALLEEACAASENAAEPQRSSGQMNKDQ